MSKIPGRVRYCCTHHHACDCREYQFLAMESALKIIATWAAVPGRGCPDADFAMIHKKAMDALNSIKGLR